MKRELEHLLPADIERRSFEIIAAELAERGIALPEETASVVKRVIHTTADFDYAENLAFSPGVVETARAALRAGAAVVTDTQMARAGINKTSLARFGGEARCFMSDPDVAAMAKENGTTRAVASMDKASALSGPLLFAVGNAPTALIRLCELVSEGRLCPAAVIGVPVGFVNVVEAKELLLESGVPCIVARGRKGGSNVAAAIVNALLYGMEGGR
ncbi:precorrin-8X methylmutase [uncultured Anaerotruncus sp.]|uniref:precorrin-8X methylmutase n=1 Tax=uncultured Anaerotruncus sp. TaxID=905011 RepID=UPI00280A92CD|nr:precorrin-8X methylmutase [uncultured Anaerotruncus sp.]